MEDYEVERNGRINRDANAAHEASVAGGNPLSIAHPNHSYSEMKWDPCIQGHI